MTGQFIDLGQYRALTVKDNKFTLPLSALICFRYLSDSYLCHIYTSDERGVEYRSVLLRIRIVSRDVFKSVNIAVARVVSLVAYE